MLCEQALRRSRGLRHGAPDIRLFIVCRQDDRHAKAPRIVVLVAEAGVFILRRRGVCPSRLHGTPQRAIGPAR
jgi:hypothetical protein